MRAQCWELNALPRKLAIKWAISSRLEYKLDPAALLLPGRVPTDCRLSILYDFFFIHIRALLREREEDISFSS